MLKSVGRELGEANAGREAQPWRAGLPTSEVIARAELMVSRHRAGTYRLYHSVPEVEGPCWCYFNPYYIITNVLQQYRLFREKPEIRC